MRSLTLTTGTGFGGGASVVVVVGVVVSTVVGPAPAPAPASVLVDFLFPPDSAPTTMSRAKTPSAQAHQRRYHGLGPFPAGVAETAVGRSGLAGVDRDA